jgi:hypothetical protein
MITLVDFDSKRAPLMQTNLGRNDPCHCGSGKKYKKCCLAKDEEARQEAVAELTAELERFQISPAAPQVGR